MSSFISGAEWRYTQHIKICARLGTYGMKLGCKRVPGSLSFKLFLVFPWNLTISFIPCAELRSTEPIKICARLDLEPGEIGVQTMTRDMTSFKYTQDFDHIWSPVHHGWPMRWNMGAKEHPEHYHFSMHSILMTFGHTLHLWYRTTKAVLSTSEASLTGCLMGWKVGAK